MRAIALPLVFGAIVCACSRQAAVCPPTAPSPPVGIVVAPAPVVAEVGEKKTSACFSKAHPRSPPPATKKSVHCSSLDARAVALVETRIRKDFEVHEKPTKLVIDFGCDLAPKDPREVWFEDGSGHGGSLRLVRLQRDDGGRFTIRAIESSHYDHAGIKLKVGYVGAREVDRAIAQARVALVSKPHLVRLHDGNDDALGLWESWSSNDFHLRLSLVGDNEEETTDRHFTGYDASSEQENILPMRLATEDLKKLLDGVPWRTEEATADDRDFLTARFVATMMERPTAYWWVRERYVALVATLGTIDAVPRLVDVIRETMTRKGSGSEERLREAAVDAVAAITGWNPRVDPFGRLGTPENAARRVVEECSPAP